MVALEPGDALGIAQSMQSDIDAAGMGEPTRLPPTPQQRYTDAVDAYADLRFPGDQETADNLAAIFDVVVAVHDEVAEANQKDELVLGSLERAAVVIDQLANRIAEATANAAHLSTRVSELEQAIEDVVTVTGVAAKNEPVVTERFLHKQTAKGWRLDESSLAIDWQGRPDPALRMELLRDAHAAGEAEATIRNNASPEP